MKIRYLHEEIGKAILESIPRAQESVDANKHHADTVITWTVGLSTGAIALILAKNPSNLLAITWLKISVAFFSIAVISGVLYRSFSYYLAGIEFKTLNSLEGYFHGMILGRTLPSPLKITDSTTIKQIAESYKKVFGINHDDWLEEGFSKDFWVSQYNEFSELYKKQSQEGIRELEKALAPLEGKMPEEMYGTLTDTAAREKKARQDTIILARFRKLCFCTYNITIIAYGIAMGMAVFGYIIK